MTELSDYKRLVEQPMIERYEAKLAGLRDRVQAAEARVEALKGALSVASGRLHWAANANPGCRADAGRALVQTWADEAAALLSKEQADG